MPDTRSVRASNVCRIAVHRPQGGDMALVLVVEDNLVKGAAGQAIQNMNLMFGLPETTGLDRAAGAAVADALALSVWWRRARQHFSHRRAADGGALAPAVAVARGRRRRASLAIVAGMWWWGFDFGQIFGGFNRKEIEAADRGARGRERGAAQARTRSCAPRRCSRRASSR